MGRPGREWLHLPGPAHSFSGPRYPMPQIGNALYRLPENSLVAANPVITDCILQYCNANFSLFPEVDASVANYVLKRIGTEGKRNRGGIEMKY